jgi:hypothetical protein
VRGFFEAMLLSGSQLGLSLVLAEFRDDLSPASFGALLLWDCIVGTCQASRVAVLAGSGSVANALDLSSVAGVTSSFDDWWCGR